MTGYRTGSSRGSSGLKWAFIAGGLGLGAWALWPGDEVPPPPAPMSEPAPSPKPPEIKPTYMAVSMAWALAAHKQNVAERGTADARADAQALAQTACEQRVAARIKRGTYMTFTECIPQGVINNQDGPRCGVLFTNEISYNISASFIKGPDPYTTEQMAKGFADGRRFDNATLYCVENSGRIAPRKLFLK